MSKSRIVLAGYVSVAVLACGLAPGAALGTPRSDLGQMAISAVAKREGIAPSSLRITNRRTARFPLLGRTVTSFKIADTRTGATFGIALNASGDPVSERALSAGEAKAYAARYGRLDPALARRLVAASSAERIGVNVWLNEPVSATAAEGRATVAVASPASTRTKAEVEQELAAVARDRAEIVSALTSPLVARLAALDVAATADTYAPVLSARLRPAQIRRVETWPEVDRIYLARRSASSLDIVVNTVGTRYLQGFGINGSGVKVGQVEVGGLVATANPYLQNLTRDLSANLCYDWGHYAPHSTVVAGIIRWNAPGARNFFSGACGGVWDGLTAGTSRAISWGAAVVNHSWGETSQNYVMADDFRARYFDTITLSTRRLQTVAAGNWGAKSTLVADPGTAYNIISVGNFNDRNTVPWDDVMNASSSWQEPTSVHNDRQLPNLSAPGTAINATLINQSPYLGWWGDATSGTSWSTPVVTGIAADLMQRDPVLMEWPVITKAILMVTAVNNIEGQARLSEYDGAGGVAAHYAEEVTRGVNGHWGGLPYTCASPAALNVMNMNLVAGKRTRVVIAWNSDPAYGPANGLATQPSADLDLHVIAPGGAVAVRSESFDNNYEIVDFTPGTSGTYAIRANRFRCDRSPQLLGAAWWRLP
jgi:hypothetical protein